MQRLRIGQPKEIRKNLIFFTQRYLKTVMADDEVSTRVQKLIEGDRAALSRTITLVESSKEVDRLSADKIMKELLNKTPQMRHRATRIGVCGAPGSGKSSLIEKLGLEIVKEQKKKLAVLAIDPSSQRTGGSILGDKTRMDLLTQESNAFVRPSPTRGILGGVSLTTGEV